MGHAMQHREEGCALREGQRCETLASWTNGLFVSNAASTAMHCSHLAVGQPCFTCVACVCSAMPTQSRCRMPPRIKHSELVLFSLSTLLLQKSSCAKPPVPKE
eukprot:502653-Amphidinium_carterae.1